ncbi:uncharacterized protein KGF55_004755 [Candida pseudojiufengensis]|uniref:uncharacterized protein n=1 Tax=Candida pseudojiufengensis TaxID=497109 RepID=UPI00222594AC|nr:uncharacterized protein KGF55_004755 [Candida pseudojiufengensis]KAI5960462.1 hypothetical protein KGF55_004755 [Candida pseudojiufengensis]
MLRLQILRCNQSRSRITIYRLFTLKSGSKYTLPKDYVQNKESIKAISLKEGWEIWKNSLSSKRLDNLQGELIKLMLPNSKENENIETIQRRIPIDNNDYINTVTIRRKNDELPIKHVVFIHGYGASLGCFARNFKIIDELKNSEKFNYHIHFLDNITFGLSSNPSIPNDNISWRIPSAARLKLIDNEPTDPKKLYKKYYKLIDGYQLDPENYKEYQEHFKPILEDMENFYTGAIDRWRKNLGLEKIDYLIGHSFGAYWCGSYSIKSFDKVSNLILLSPVGLERNIMAITNTDEITNKNERPTLDPTSYKFLSRFPILSRNHILNWYYKIPYLPRILKFLGPFGVQYYFKMWLSKLSKINKLIKKHGGPQKIFQNSNDLVIGSQKEINLIIEYLYNSITNGTNSDIYVKYLLTPATVSKWPLMDKFLNADLNKISFNTFVFYGQYDFMNSEAGEKMIKKLNEKNTSKIKFEYDEIAEGGHNLYIDNPFDTNKKIAEIILNQE